MGTFTPANLDAQAAISRANAMTSFKSGFCLEFVNDMLQAPPSDRNVLYGKPYMTAKQGADYTPLDRRHGLDTAKVGMIAYFSNGQAAGHVAIINGIPTVRSTDKPVARGVETVTIDEIVHSWGGRPFRFATDWFLGHNVVNLGAPLSTPTTPASPGGESLEAVAREVIAGQWGNGQDRKDRLTASGYNYDAVQAEVNALLNAGSPVHRTYTVQHGDTLSGIAGRLNYPGGWKTLYNKNRGVIGGNPNVIRAGQVLSL